MSIFQGPPSGYPLIKPTWPKVEQSASVNGDTRDVTKPFEVPQQEGGEIEWLDAHSLPDAYDLETLDKIIRSYVEQVRILKMFNYDMVSIHMAYRGTLPVKFFSPLTTPIPHQRSGGQPGKTHEISPGGAEGGPGGRGQRNAD